jgi:hypothetical protein
MVWFYTQNLRKLVFHKYFLTMTLDVSVCMSSLNKWYKEMDFKAMICFTLIKLRLPLKWQRYQTRSLKEIID